MAVYGEKLLRLVEQQINQAGGTAEGVRLYEQQFRSDLGIVEEDGRDARIDFAKRTLSPRDFSFGELTRAFCGKHGRFSAGEFVEQMQKLPMYRMRLAEAEGHVVLPSSFANISAFSATVFGLLDAMAIEAYMDPEFIGDQFFAEEETRMNGGSKIGVMNDGQWGDLLQDGEPYPTVGLKETKIAIPENERRGNVIQLNEKDMIYDRTGTIAEKATKAGEAVRRGKEIRQADTFLGISNTYSRDGVTNNTYLDAAGTVPNDYVNTSVNVLEDFTDVDAAVQIIEGNRDPGTGFEITVPEPYKVAVMPMRWLRLKSIIKATEVETRTQTSTELRRFENPLYAIDPIKLTRLWYNRLIAAGVSADNAEDRWFLSPDFKKAFVYKKLIAFENVEAPLSSEDMRRDIVLIRIAREHGVPMIVEPRYSYMGTQEDLTP